MAAALLILGLIIVVRGIVEVAPLTFTVLGVLMVVLGLYRLHLLYRVTKGQR
jgi:hypothetical protein